jgi:hypothetical protein
LLNCLPKPQEMGQKGFIQVLAWPNVGCKKNHQKTARDIN